MADEQLQFPLRLSARQFAPVGAAVQGARRFAARQGRQYHQSSEQLQVNPQVGHAIMLEYRNRQNQPISERIRRSYAAMASEVEAQHHYMTHAGGVRHEVTREDPYENSPGFSGVSAAVGAHRDVTRHGRMKTLATESTGGHEYFTNRQNDQFRAAHDYFGHLATGRGTSRHGEEAAFQSHYQMFSPAAREALTSETRGQNSFVNYHPLGPQFPDQGPGSNLVSMPRWAQRPDAGEILRQRSLSAERSRPEPGVEQRRLPLPGLRRPALP